MVSKKHVFIVGLLCLLASATQAQTEKGYDWKDSSKIPTSRLPQHTEFLNNNYPYPAKPRSQWELGFAAGNSVIFGDVNPKANIGGAITLRKALSHTFSYRIGYFGSKNQGYPSSYKRDFLKYRSYQNWTHSAALDFIASLTPNSPYRGNPKTNLYLLGGVNLIATKVFYAKPNGQQIDNAYSVFYGNGVSSESNVAPYSVPGIPNTMSGAITTFGAKPKTDFLKNGRRGWTLLGGLSAGAGISFKMSKKVNLGVEQRFVFTPYDYLDAVKNNSNDVYSFTSARLNINIGSSSKRVEPLWWLNGNNYVYNELNRPTHMVIPAPVLPDGDGDGVTDQFDMEPNTPAGSPVDVRGMAKDTDGDGVPDYKDKELLTASKCFPVNADGVGTCPEPACCTELRGRVDSLIANGVGTHGGGDASCSLTGLPSIKFDNKSARLSTAAMGLLSKAADRIKASPDCRIKVVGHGLSDKSSQQLSWDRVNTVIRYLVEKKGIAQDRFIFSYGEEGDPNAVDLSGTTEQGPNTVPAPHPNLQQKGGK